MVNFTKAVQKLYTGHCDVYEYTKVKDPVTKQTVVQETLVIAGEPCRISHKTKPVGKPTDEVVQLGQTVMLYISPTLEIKAGSKIEVSQNGRTVSYASAGQPAMYKTHQEISLELWVDRA